MNNTKRIFSCFSVWTICLLANMGFTTKAMAASPVNTIIQNKDISAKQTQFTLRSPVVELVDKQKLAGHYSHSSHSSHYSHSSHGSHQSHYSSGF